MESQKRLIASLRSKNRWSERSTELRAVYLRTLSRRCSGNFSATFFWPSQRDAAWQKGLIGAGGSLSQAAAFLGPSKGGALPVGSNRRTDLHNDPLDRDSPSLERVGPACAADSLGNIAEFRVLVFAL